MKKVLITDDNPEHRYLLKSVLEGYGFEVDEAQNGRDALQKAFQSKPDLLISDLLMPGMDGYALLRLWKEDDDLREIPFLVYTATYTDQRDEQLAIDLGADAFLVKPADTEVFLDCLRKLLDRDGSEISVPRVPTMNENELLEEYSQALVRKLEFKASQLEQTNRELREEAIERERTQAALRASEERYRNLFHSVVDPLFVYDRETLQYLDVNNAAVRTYGYSREEFLNMNLVDLRPAEEIPRLKEALKEATLDRCEARGIWQHRKKSGEIIDVEIATHGLEVEGRPAVLVQARDVTAQRRAAEEIARTSELLQAVTDGTTDAVFVKDREGRYLFYNRAASKYVGRSIGDVLGRTDVEIFGQDEARVVMQNDRDVMTTKQPKASEVRLTTAEGTRIFHALKVPYLDKEGHVIGVIGVSRELTELKQAEQAVRLRDRAIQSVSQGIVITDPHRRITPPFMPAPASFP